MFHSQTIHTNILSKMTAQHPSPVTQQRRVSSDSDLSRRSSEESTRDSSDASVPIPEPYRRSTQVYDPNEPLPYSSERAEEARKELEPQNELDSTQKKRRYSMELSKMMGKQLVEGLNVNKGMKRGAEPPESNHATR
ncbi:hypothetical protein EJ04DRAFT_82559 [Polyplosphaeria fusca]|uniref:Uncharacterized protein n=1 Tax=Polyplosphaeria fusca TaxID=682080 RepID=A0A9P4UW83_9PLEO|nr:hypothetical protein EJ04DRAFT_82559 [Polyplosphaeria fusca]